MYQQIRLTTSRGSGLAAVLSASAPYTSNFNEDASGLPPSNGRRGCAGTYARFRWQSATLTMIWDCARCRVFSVMTRGSSTNSLTSRRKSIGCPNAVLQLIWKKLAVENDAIVVSTAP